MNLRKLRPWAFYFLAWTLVGLIYFAQNVTRRFYWEDPNPWQDLRYWTANIYIAALLTPLIVAAGRRWPLERQQLARLIGLHLRAQPVLGGAQALPRGRLPSHLERVLAHQATDHAQERVLAAVHLRLSHQRGGVLGGALDPDGVPQLCSLPGTRPGGAALRPARLAAGNPGGQARLGALKAQLQPHFLFNTLNAIVVLVRQQKGQQAEETLARFSDLLRAVLADMDAQEVTLARELEYLKLYLSIEQLRFSDRLRVDFDVDPELLDAAVPHMSLQPIVENAIRHGVGPRATPGVIEIRARRAGDSLNVIVRDDGPGFRAGGTEHGMGLGLANTRARLRAVVWRGRRVAHRERRRVAAPWSRWCCRFTWSKST